MLSAVAVRMLQDPGIWGLAAGVSQRLSEDGIVAIDDGPYAAVVIASMRLPEERTLKKTTYQQARLAMEPWWTAQQAGMIGGFGGSALGMLGAAMGVIGGVCLPLGKYKALVMGLIGLGVVVGVVSLAFGVAAVVSKQPYHVYYPLLLSGGISTVVFTPWLFLAPMLYRQAEMRKLEAEELRRG
jgi:hypothetical protein